MNCKWLTISILMTLILIVSTVAACSPSLRTVQMPQVEDQSGRLQVLSLQSFTSTDGYSHHLMIVRDAATGYEYLVVFNGSAVKLK